MESITIFHSAKATDISKSLKPFLSSDPQQHLAHFYHFEDFLGLSHQINSSYRRTNSLIFIVSRGEFSDFLGFIDAWISSKNKHQLERLLIVLPVLNKDNVFQALIADRLFKLKSIVGELSIIQYPLLYSEILHHRKTLIQERLFRLPLPDYPLPWISPEDLAKQIYTFAMEKRGNHMIICRGPELYTPSAVAYTLSGLLQQKLEAAALINHRLKLLDKNGDGKVSREEIYQFLNTIGFEGNEIAQLISTNYEAQSISALGLKFQHYYQEFHQLLKPYTSTIQFVEQVFDHPEDADSSYWLTERSQEQEKYFIRSLKSVEGGSYNVHTSETLHEWIERHIFRFTDLYVLPEIGYLTIKETQLKEKKAKEAKITFPDGRILSRSSTIDKHYVELYWRNHLPFQREKIRIDDQEGQNIELADSKIVKLSGSPLWDEWPEASELLYQKKELEDLQYRLLKHSGHLSPEKLPSNTDSREIICDCVDLTTTACSQLINEGLDTIEAIAAKTSATTVCGSCRSRIEQLLKKDSMEFAQVVENKALNKDINLLKIQKGKGNKTTYKAGQHITLEGWVDKKWIGRSYTLTAPVNQHSPYEIAVKREKDGKLSNWLCDHAKEDALIRVSPPKGEFTLDKEADPIFFFAGGIGITPALGMLRTMLKENDHRQFYLDWSASDAKSFVFQKELAEIAQRHPSLSIYLRDTQKEGRLNFDSFPKEYVYESGAIAYLCGPVSYMDQLRNLLQRHLWPEPKIKQEYFASPKLKKSPSQHHINKDDGSSKSLGKCPIHHEGFHLKAVNKTDQLEEAEAFIHQFFSETGWDEEAFKQRWQVVKEELELYGSYHQTYEELVFGARVAWRNSARCIGRFFWDKLEVLDQRHLKNADEVFQAILTHLEKATNGGDIQPYISIFDPHRKWKLWNPQLIQYACYEEEGKTIGDPQNLELTKKILDLGWPGGPKTQFDILPIVIEEEGQDPVWFEIPADMVLEIPLSHPDYSWFEELNLKWYAVPAVSGMALDLGGIQYKLAPFNGFYMGTEIGGRNLSDGYRYDLLSKMAEKMGIDTSSDFALWKDRAMVELNVAVLHSYKLNGVRILDHHTLSEYFMKFDKTEQAQSRTVYADWTWLVPPISGSSVEIFHIDKWENKTVKPNYLYM